MLTPNFHIVPDKFFNTLELKSCLMCLCLMLLAPRPFLIVNSHRHHGRLHCFAFPKPPGVVCPQPCFGEAVSYRNRFVLLERKDRTFSSVIVLHQTSYLELSSYDSSARLLLTTRSLKEISILVSFDSRPHLSKQDY